VEPQTLQRNQLETGLVQAFARHTRRGYLIEVATRTRRTPGAVLLPADFATETKAASAAA